MTTGKTIALTRWTFVGKVMHFLLHCFKNSYKLVLDSLFELYCGQSAMQKELQEVVCKESAIILSTKHRM